MLLPLKKNNNTSTSEAKNFESWTAKVNYDLDWKQRLTVFSSIKSMFAEYVSTRKFPNMIKEMMC
jgi:hypothetical protein